MALPVPTRSPSAPNSPGAGSPSAPGPTAPTPPAAMHPLAARVPTGLPYGQAQQLANAQHAMPVGGQPAGPAPPMPPGGMPGGGPTPMPPGAMDAATQYVPPDLGLGGPSERPGEPITHGIATGPGAGPEALAPLRAPDPLSSGLAILNQLGDQVDPETAKLRNVVQAMIGNRMAQ